MLITSNFTGYFKIAQDVNTTEILADYIIRLEQKYLVDLFGFELYELFIADLSGGVPQDARFTVIYEALNFTNGNEPPFYPIGGMPKSCLSDYRPERVEPTYSSGMLDMLKGFIYFEFVNEYGYEVSQTGVTINKNENSEPLAGAKHLALIESRYNGAVNSYKVIQNYMIANPDTYPEFAGTSKDTTYWGGAF